MKRVALLISGGGSNMLALVRDMVGDHPCRAVLVASNMTHSSFWLSTENHFFILLSVLLMAAVPSRSRSTLQPSREPV